MIKLGRGRFELIKQQQQQEAASYLNKEKKNTREELSARNFQRDTP